MTAAALSVFAVSFAVCAWVYAGYPALIWTLSRLRPRPVRRKGGEPPVTVLVAAHNEAATIADKVRNCLALQYPAERLEVLVATNGCTDRTEAIVRAFAAADGRVRLVSVSRRGKAFALNEGARTARGEILVFTDCNTVVDPEALAALVANYADPEVGAVTGNKRAQAEGEADATAAGEGIYWRYEMWQKRCESAFGSCYIGDGSLHSIRRSLYVPIADPAQGDDIAISTRAVLQGCRLIFEPLAVVRERASTSEGQSELKRKMRVTNRSMRALFGLGGRLFTSGFYSLELLSHKVLRHLVPFFMIPLLGSNLLLAAVHPVLAAFAAGQALFYGLGAAGWLARRSRLARARPLWIPYYFLFVNTAAFLGVCELLRGTRPVTWKPRTGEVGEG